MGDDIDFGAPSSYPRQQIMGADAVVSVDLDSLHTRILGLPPGPPVPWFLDVDGVMTLT